MLNLLVTTPAYNCMVHQDHKKSCLQLQAGAIKAGIGLEFLDVGNQVTKKARNSMISYFYFHKEFTHYICLDADVGVSTNCFPTLLGRKVDVIGIPTPLAGFEKDGKPAVNIGPVVQDYGKYAEVEYAACSVVMLSRAAVDAIVPTCQQYTDDPRFTRGVSLTEVVYDVYLPGVMDGVYRPEDMGLYYRLRKLGFPMYIERSVWIKHNKMIGLEAYRDGNN